MVGLVYIATPAHVVAITNPDAYENQALQKPTEQEIQEAQEAAEQAAEDALSKELTAKAEKLVGKRGGQCVIFVRNFLGVGRDQIQGLAKNTKVNSQEPEVGSIIVLNASRWGHVGVVLFTEGDTIVYADSNGSWTQRVAIRQIKINDKRIKGYRVIN